MPRITLLVLFFPLLSVAQSRLNLTVNAGFSNYTGDLQEKRFTLDQSHLTVGAGLSYEILPKLLIRGELQYGKLGADDKHAPRQELRDRNLNFTTALLEGSFILDYSIFSLETRNLTPYVFAGIGLYRFNPYTYDTLGNKYFLKNLGTEGQGLAMYPDREKYKLVQFSVPFGGGIRIRVNDNTYLSYELGLRKLFTDYIDDVSTTYADRAALLAGRGSKAVELAYRGAEVKAGEPYPVGGTLRGSPKFKDWYYFSVVKLSVGITNESGRLFGRYEGKGSVSCPRF